MPRHSVFALLIGSSAACDLAHPELCPESPVVTTNSGPVQGFDRTADNHTVSTFFSLPFAEPPVGELRFHYPKPLSRTWTDTYRNLTHAPGCVNHGGSGQEDCLYLNVYTPRAVIGLADQDLLPVMFWIYGGGFTSGDAFSFPGLPALYDGLHLAASHDVVVVTHNYRVNVLGFNTYTKGESGQTGTQAMEDQRMAMKWTNGNIKSFGGNPERVTIFGESAGALSVHYHLTSPPSWPYFAQAISESGTSRLSWFFQPKDLAEDLYKSWADAVSCTAGDHQLQCLQALPAINFTIPPAGLRGRSPLFPNFPVGPVVDGTEHGLLDKPDSLIAAGRHHKVPLMLGSNVDDGSLFAPILGSIAPGSHKEPRTKEDLNLIIDWVFSSEDRTKIHKLYKPDEFGILNPVKYYKTVSKLMRDAGFMCSDRFVARQWRDQGLEAFLYTFSFNYGDVVDSLPLGTFHGSEIPFVWHGLLDVIKLFPGHGNQYTMAEIIACQWATFVHTGRPSGTNSSLSTRGCDHVHGVIQDWPSFTDEEHYYSLMDSPVVRKLQAANTYPDDERPSNKKCDMWDTVSYPWHDNFQNDVLI